MREAFVGFDSAWGGKQLGGIVSVSFDNGEFDSWSWPEPASFECAARIIEKLRDKHNYVLVALDQPTLVPNEKGMRPVERVASSLVCKLRGGVQPANRSKSALFGPNAPIWKFLNRIDARENPTVARGGRRGLHLIEVFPALALPALEPHIMSRGHAARYNPDKTFSLCDWKLVANAVARHAEELGVPRLSQWARAAAGYDRVDKTLQDQLDAAICLIIALRWRRAPSNRVAVIGDGQHGYMVTPISTETKRILQSAAKEREVPFNDFYFLQPER